MNPNSLRAMGDADTITIFMDGEYYTMPEDEFARWYSARHVSADAAKAVVRTRAAMLESREAHRTAAREVRDRG